MKKSVEVTGGWDGIAAVSARDRIVLVSLIPHGLFAPGSEAVTAENREPKHNSGLLDIEQKELKGFRVQKASDHRG